MRCSICDKRSVKVADFGSMALAGGFLKREDFNDEKLYPLELYFCESCYLLEVGEKVDPRVLFSKYFYHSSATPGVKEHYARYARYITERFKPKTILEIGCNDGVLLEPLSQFAETTGIDPAGLCGSIKGYFGKETAKSLGKFDLIVANNVLAHMQDINGVVAGIKHCLNDNGVFVFEVHSLLAMVEKFQYDWCYHEHYYYYSLLTLEKLFAKFSMKIFDVQELATHGGSRRYYVCKDDRKSTHAVYTTRYHEVECELYDLNTYLKFAMSAKAHRAELQHTVDTLQNLGNKVIGYGASGRANTLIQYCGLELEYIIDDAEAKHGYYTPGSHIPIKAYSEIGVPDYILVFAWPHLADIIPRCVSPVIIPFPKPRIE